MNVFPLLLFDYKKMRNTEENEFILTNTFKINISRYILLALIFQPKYYIFYIYHLTLNKNSSFHKKILKGSKGTNIYLSLRYYRIYVISYNSSNNSRMDKIRKTNLLFDCFSSSTDTRHLNNNRK